MMEEGNEERSSLAGTPEAEQRLGSFPSQEDASLPSRVATDLSAYDPEDSSTQHHEAAGSSSLLVTECAGNAMKQTSEMEDAQTALATPPLSFLPSPMNINNCNAQELAIPSASACNPDEESQQNTGAVVPRVRSKVCSKHPTVEVTLDDRNLWEDFYSRGTEMIVNRAGRRMFPGFAVSITGLKPKAKYTMRVEVVLADNHRFKFLNSRWLAVGGSEPQPPSTVYDHPDSPNTGSFWTRHGVSFKKLKITNNKDRPGQNALLHSMHKYYLRLIVDEERKVPAGEAKLPPRNILTQDFIETSFIAVTAYQNEEVTQLKITNNPFAKAFRENAGDYLDYDTMQALYGHPSHGYAGSSPSFTPPGQCMITSPPSQWTAAAMPSPLLSPHPGTPSITALHQHISPIGGFTPSPSPQVSQSIVPAATPQYFQWPPLQQRTSTTQLQPLAPPPPPPPPLPSTPGYYQQAAAAAVATVGGGVNSSPPLYFTGQSPVAQLPDFDSVFTPSGSSSQS